MSKEQVNHPDHYNTQPIECIEIVKLYYFNVGNAIKYIWRCEHKGNKLQDLEKAKFYIKEELKLEREFSFNPLDYGLPQYFDDLDLTFSKNIYDAIYYVYGFYDKKRLLKCLYAIDNEIFTLI